MNNWNQRGDSGNDRKQRQNRNQHDSQHNREINQRRGRVGIRRRGREEEAEEGKE